MPAAKDYLNSKFGKNALEMLNFCIKFCKQHNRLPYSYHQNTNSLTSEQRYERKLRLFLDNYIRNNNQNNNDIETIKAQIKNLLSNYANGYQGRSEIVILDLLKEMEDFCYEHEHFPGTYRTPQTEEEFMEDNLNRRLDYFYNEETKTPTKTSAFKKIHLFREVYFKSKQLEIEEVKLFIKCFKIFLKSSQHNPSQIQELENQRKLYLKAHSIIHNYRQNPELAKELKDVKEKVVSARTYYKAIKDRQDISTKQKADLITTAKLRDEDLALQLLEKFDSYQSIRGLRAYIAYYKQFPNLINPKTKIEGFVAKRINNIWLLNNKNPHLNEEANTIIKLQNN